MADLTAEDFSTKPRPLNVADLDTATLSALALGNDAAMAELRRRLAAELGLPSPGDTSTGRRPPASDNQDTE